MKPINSTGRVLIVALGLVGALGAAFGYLSVSEGRLNSAVEGEPSSRLRPPLVPDAEVNGEPTSTGDGDGCSQPGVSQAQAVAIALDWAAEEGFKDAQINVVRHLTAGQLMSDFGMYAYSIACIWFVEIRGSAVFSDWPPMHGSPTPTPGPATTFTLLRLALDAANGRRAAGWSGQYHMTPGTPEPTNTPEPSATYGATPTNTPTWRPVTPVHTPAPPG
jgi:hypothetical protein